MNGWLILLIIFVYFSLLILISWITGKKSDSDTFFRGNRSSPWYLVAFGMIGTSISGVTFISVPGWVNDQQFAYFAMVIGYLFGYGVIAFLLMPLYYRLNLTSIYTYLESRLGIVSYKTGAAFFLLSRTVGASFRMFLVAIVFQLILKNIGFEVHFAIPVIISFLLVYSYTFRGGIKTIVWTDSFQTIFLIGSAALTVWWIAGEMGWGLGEMISAVGESEYSKIFFTDDFNDKKHFIRQMINGAFIAIVMTGLDQDMMQKNLTCRNLKEAQWNMSTFCLILVFVNLIFLFLGALLFMYGNSEGFLSEEVVKNQVQLFAKDPVCLTGDCPMIKIRSDEVFPLFALNFFNSTLITILFILGITAAAYASVDSALASLTTSFCIDFLSFGTAGDESKKKKIRTLVHAGFSALMVIVVLIFQAINNQAVIETIFTVAGFTYGPLLGLFAFGLLTRRPVRDRYSAFICIAAPLISYWLSKSIPDWGFNIGWEILLVNGAITFLGLWMSGMGVKTKDNEQGTMNRE